MRIKETKVYPFDELSDDAKQKAIDRYRYKNNDLFWDDENRETLNAFERVFPIKIKDWEYGYRNYISFEMTVEHDEIEELTGWRLVSYLWNNYRTDLYKGRYYNVKANHPVRHKRVTSKTFKNGNTHNAYRSAVFFENSCPLTGYCMDDDILEDIYKYINKPDGRTFKELLNDCLYNWIKACNADVEYQNSDEFITEEIKNREYEFDECGNIA